MTREGPLVLVRKGRDALEATPASPFMAGEAVAAPTRGDAVLKRHDGQGSPMHERIPLIR